MLMATIFLTLPLAWLLMTGSGGRWVACGFLAYLCLALAGG
jgi:hypothetical protein